MISVYLLLDCMNVATFPTRDASLPLVVAFRDYCFYITKFKYHLCYYLNLFAILAKGTVW